MDTDGDGVVSKDEFLDWWQRQDRSEREQLLGGVALTQAELAESLNLPPREAAELFEEVEEDIQETYNNKMQGQVTKMDLVQSMTQLMLMLHKIDGRLQKLEAVQKQ